jgi:hypothetical protein
VERRGPRRGVDEADPLVQPSGADQLPKKEGATPPPTASETGHASEVALHERWGRWELARRKFEARTKEAAPALPPSEPTGGEPTA